MGWRAGKGEGRGSAAGPPGRPIQEEKEKSGPREKKGGPSGQMREGRFSSFYFFPNPFSTLSFQIQAKFNVNHIKSKYVFNILFISNINEQFW